MPVAHTRALRWVSFAERSRVNFGARQGFPSKYFDVVREASASDVPLMNATEYLEHLFAAGLRESDLPEIQPLFQSRIWARLKPGDGSARLHQVIDELRREDSRFHMDGGSWTSNLTWVQGYENVLGPMEEASALFHDKITRCGMPTCERRYRYWGQGQWTDYGRELCRRAMEILTQDY